MAVDNNNDKSIQAVLNAFEREKALLRKICRSPTRSDMMVPYETLAAARGLQSYLLQCVTKIETAYNENRINFGKEFLVALCADHAIVSTIQSATLNLMNQIMIVQECLDEPATFKPESIQALQSESNACYSVVLDLLSRLSEDFTQNRASARKVGEHAIDIRLVDAASRTPQLSPKTDTPRSMNFQSQIRDPASPTEPSRLLGKPPQVIEELPSSSRSITYQHKTSSTSSSQKYDARFSVSSTISGSSSSEQVPLIPTEEIQHRIIKNENFLARRRQSKVEFHEELQAFSTTWSSERKNEVLALASTLRLPGFGVHVAEGMEVINRELSSTDVPDGLIPVNEPNGLTPASTLSVDCAMGHDSSFYRYGGFCEGARMALKGEKSYKVIKRPKGSKMNFTYEEIGEDAPAIQTVGLFVAVVTARCLKCSYEVDWYNFKKDKLRDKSGIYSHEDLGIRYRQSFLSKSHFKAKSMQESIYACIFCVDENKTPEVHDATIFFSAAQLMRHISIRHRQIQHVDGIKVSYSYTDQDFDLSFTSHEATTDPLSSSSIEIASLPTALAIQAHRPKGSGKFYQKDPNGNTTLQFAINAQIAGVTFPRNFNGEWCSGYHDFSRGLFPAEMIQLKPPPQDEIIMNAKSSLVAIARWDHSPKNTSAGWLAFSRREKIIHVEYPYAEHWCWSGQNSKGRWGFFPKDFVELVGEETGMERGGGRVEGQRWKLKGMLPGFHGSPRDDGSGRGRKARRR